MKPLNTLAICKLAIMLATIVVANALGNPQFANAAPPRPSQNSGFDAPQTGPIRRQQPIVKSKRIKKGGWRTLESFWNSQADIVFRKPAGAKVKVRYGVGSLAKDRQKQTLPGNKPLLVEVGKYSVLRARVQIYVEADTDVTYSVYPGGVNTVKIPF